ncbi:bifunctional PIG-L family deacetylase/class I SAM-dependent methyltransferase [Falsarthrobacter nasiphocae]|uniref:LmbE family N-acetylglucosaminyl deacetylase/SAM-dependent methyltransferase n=1 Tax=Falsarthrobacter nasiphocae TaxID=189863 RepID=A0AAE3YEN8_9MICC|nr:bifunctional PIG-L family deacetylase/class I SAM-dependent methyltransferase [Falsarthrobacter nasiphocae]MDR6891810.1 LmbE family N-acetylglucosaminyl deacetylase/SAM-dependent methyltransferase [Falsarthrobacter nasiphocae]
MVTFHHTDASTPEESWLDAGVGQLPLLDARLLAGASRVVVLAAHPDDELLGCAALLAETERLGVDTVAILFTGGENSHPRSPTVTPEQLAELRAAEFEALSGALFPSARTVHPGLTDGRVAESPEAVRDALDAALAGCDAARAVVVSPRHDDGHPDHETLGEAALAAGRALGATVLEYPIWYWHWAGPEDARWRSWVRLPDPAGLDRDALWALYPTQTRPLSPAPGDEAIVQPDFLAHFLRGFETFEVTQTDRNEAAQAHRDEAALAHPDAARVFDQVHQDDDPWRTYTSAYEARKRATLIGLLKEARGGRVPGSDESELGRGAGADDGGSDGASADADRPYARAFEIGCSVGALTGDLTRISERVLAVDASAEALEQAQAKQGGRAGVEFRQMLVPESWPEGSFDLIVLSETGYYLTEADLRATFAKIAASASGGGAVVALCHWRGDIEGWPLDAAAVHRMARETWPGERVASHEDPDFLIDLFDIAGPSGR